MNIQEFCTEHDACSEGKQWATDNCKDMMDVWSKSRPEWLVWTATRPGVLTDKELRLFAVWSARQVQPLMTDPRSINALDVAERHAHGQATDEELDAASDAAWEAASDAASAAASDAAWAAAWAAAWEAASDAASAAASDAAWAAAWDASRAAAWAATRGAVSAAAWAATCDAQAKWLRENTKPNFN